MKIKLGHKYHRCKAVGARVGSVSGVIPCPPGNHIGLRIELDDGRILWVDIDPASDDLWWVDSIRARMVGGK